MADQATLKGSARAGHTNGSAPGVVGSITEFGNDVFTLVELQAKLAAIDAKESKDRALLPIIVAVVAVVVIVAAIPVALLGVADLLARALNIAPGWTMLLTALVTLAIAALIGFLSVKEVGRSLEPLRRSHEELVRNLAWIRTVLVYSGRSTPPRRG